MNREIYQKNIEAIAKRYKKTAEYLENTDCDDIEITKDDDFSLSFEDSKGMLVARRNHEKISLSSKYDNEEILDIWFKGLHEEWKLNAKLLMYGFGTGLYVRKFLKSARKDCSIIVFEPSGKILRKVIENIDVADLFSDGRFSLVFWPTVEGNNFKRFYTENFISFSDLSSIVSSFYLNYPRLFPNNSQWYFEEVSRSTRYVASNQHVLDRFGHDYNRNVFNNLIHMKDSLSLDSLRDNMPEGMTAIVVAAGPSLDKNIKELKKAEGKCLIVSTDTALKPLALAGVNPDISMILDGKKDDKYLSEKASRGVPMVCTPYSGDSFLRLHEGEKLYTDTYCDHIRNFCKKENIPFERIETGGSVANSCFAIAKYLKCKTIILVGQDLAYTGDKTHSAVTVRGAKYTAVEDLENVVWSVDINGEKIRSSAEFQFYKEWFEEKIVEFPELTVIDATEGGVKIEGTIIKNLDDAIKEYCTGDFDFGKVFDKTEPLMNEEQKKSFGKMIRAIPDNFRKMRELAIKTSADYANIIRMAKGSYDSRKIKKLLKQCSDCLEKIESYDEIEYVNNQLQDKASKLYNEIFEIADDEKTEIISSCQIAKKHLDEIVECIDEMKPYMDLLNNEFN